MLDSRLPRRPSSYLVDTETTEIDSDESEDCGDKKTISSRVDRLQLPLVSCPTLTERLRPDDSSDQLPFGNLYCTVS
jgi:hypothetical protein